MVIASMLIAYLGSFWVSMLTAQRYLTEQLAIKNTDNASILALSLSHQEKDLMMVELQIAAVFDTGQYASVRLLDPQGEILVERLSEQSQIHVPKWFMGFFPIPSQRGVAQVTSGWQQFGQIEVISHAGFAYLELWQGAIKLFVWFSLGAVLLGAMMTRPIRLIKAPLERVVAQANAISERHFLQIDEPEIPELRHLAKAMNAMVSRVRDMFIEEARRLEQLRREIATDILTGLESRAYFLAHLDEQLNSEESSPFGVAILLRVDSLAEINNRLGRRPADELLCATASLLKELAIYTINAHTGRLNGSDFCLLLPGERDEALYAEKILEMLPPRTVTGQSGVDWMVHLGVARYVHGEAAGALLARLDGAIAIAATCRISAWQAAQPSALLPSRNADEWRALIHDSVQGGHVQLAEFPVLGRGDSLLHLECPLRLTASDGQCLSGGQVIPMAARLGVTIDVDRRVLELALLRIRRDQMQVAVNVSIESFAKSTMIDDLAGVLCQEPALAKCLWLEVSEQGVFANVDLFREMALKLRPLGCQIGIEHLSGRFSEIGKVCDFGVDYLKVDGALIRGAADQHGTREFLAGLCSVAHKMDMIVIAEGVHRIDLIPVLWELGFDGVTGPGVRFDA